ncbi:MAG: mechanosensitive ion channel, partial [Chlamydiia bacterium]|nr:mechanosensitive ion channel [Chlamydiia bacterium]
LHYVIVISGIIIALSTLGLTFSNIAIIIGALGIGIGFGLQNIVNNFLCGLAILFERNVKIGDYVELESGLKGKITEVNVQNTTIHTHDGLDILVPNSMIVGKQLVNWTKKDPFQRLHVPFGVAYGTDQEKVRQVVLDAIKDLSPTLDQTRGVPNPEVWLVKFGESSLDFELVVWVNIYRSRGHRALTALYLSTIETAFKHNGITIPFPQRDLHLKTFPHSLIK